eukprot:1849656-Rhodomonas_salina.2
MPGSKWSCVSTNVCAPYNCIRSVNLYDGCISALRKCSEERVCRYASSQYWSMFVDTRHLCTRTLWPG